MPLAERLRPLLPARGPRPLLQPASRTTRTTSRCRRSPPDSGYYATTAIADHAIKCLKDHARAARRAAVLPATSPSPRRTSRCTRCRRTSPATATSTSPAGTTMRERALAAGMQDTGPRARRAVRRRARRRARRTTFPTLIEKLGPGEVNRPLPWSELTRSSASFRPTKMAIHAAMVDRMDREIGRVARPARGDGRARQHAHLLPLRQRRQRRDHGPRRRPRSRRAARLGAPRYLCLGPGWSSVGNTPFRRHKTWVHEGGIATPLIVHWPQGIAARGELRAHARPRHRPRADDPGARGRDAPRSLRRVPPRPGQSLVPALVGRRRRRSRPPVVAARGEPRDPRGRLEARAARAKATRGSSTTSAATAPSRTTSRETCRGRRASWAGSGRRGRGSSRSTRSTAARSAAPRTPRPRSGRRSGARPRPGGAGRPTAGRGGGSGG